MTLYKYFSRYEYEEDEKVDQTGIESPSKHVYILLYQRVDALTHDYL